jgi:hypothetical protein
MNEELDALKNLEVSPENLRELYMRGDLGDLKEKLNSVEINDEGLTSLRDDIETRGREEIEAAQAELKDRLESERNKAEAKLKKVADGAMEDAEDMGIGYGASAVSLITMSIFAPQVVMACRLKPSAVVYAGTAAVYLARELKNSMKFRANALSEIEYVEVNLDSSKGISENVDTAKQAFNLQFELINRYKGFMDKAVDSIEEKSKSAKMASYGFFAASAVAAAETFGFDAGACTGGVTQVFSAPVEKLPVVLHAIDQSSSAAEAYVEYLHFERMGRGELSTITLDEFENLKSVFSVTPFDFKSVFKSAALALATVAIPPVSAQEITVKKYELSPQLKQQEAKYLMDVDKIFALVVGGSSLAASQFIPGYRSMLRKIVSSGATRAVVFGANGAVALLASKYFDEAAVSLQKKMQDLQQLLDRGQELGNQGFELIDSFLEGEDAKSLAGQLGIDRGLSDQVVKELEQDLKEKAKDDLMDQLPQDVEVNEDLLKNFTSRTFQFRELLSQLLINSAHARVNQNLGSFRLRCYDAGSCPAPPFPVMSHASFKRLNSFLKDYQNYATLVYATDDNNLSAVEKRIEQQEQTLQQYRAQLYKAINQQMQQKKQQPLSFHQLEKKEQQEILKLVNNSFESKMPVLSPPREKLESKLRVAEEKNTTKPVPKAIAVHKKGSISALDYNVLMGLIDRLELSMTSAQNAYAHEEQSYWPLHSKETSLFDAIHHRHRQVLSPFYLQQTP